MMHACCVRVRIVRQTRSLARFASTTANPYPYPQQANPTPHQIFHLPRSASKEDVKQRYFELVRIYHPDSPVNRALPTQTTEARFRSITDAYDALRGKSKLLVESSDVETVKKNFHNLNTAMWKARQQRRAELRVGLDDKWKDAVILGGIVATIAAFVAQTYFTRREALVAQQERAMQRKLNAASSALEAQTEPRSISEGDHK